MKYRYVFLLGRPGCGKSALYRELEKRINESDQAVTFERVDDFPIVWAKLQIDDALETQGKERIHSKRTDDGAYLITSDNFFNEVLQEVNSDVLEIDKANHIVFLEFARSNYIESFQYFDKSIRDRCIAIYMEVDFEICWARNVARHERAITEEGDDHFVDRETMEKFFGHDDQEAFVRYLEDHNVPVAVVNNEAEGQGHLKRQVEELYNRLF